MNTNFPVEKMAREPNHPGKRFHSRFIKDLNLSITTAANYLGVSRGTLSNFVNGKASCSPEMAAKIAAATSTSVALWLNLQARHDAWKAAHINAENVTRFPG